MMQLNKPNPSEYPPYFAGYIEKSEAGASAAQLLLNNKKKTISFLSQLTDEQWDYRYALGKWSLKEAFIHLIDTERIMTYRALRAGRGDHTPLPGFNQDDYIPFYQPNHRTPTSIIEEFGTVRNASITLFKHFNDAAMDRVTQASGHPVSVRALLFIILGHAQHHLDVATERYLT